MTVGGGAKSGSQNRLPFMQHGDVINMKVGIRERTHSITDVARVKEESKKPEFGPGQAILESGSQLIAW